MKWKWAGPYEDGITQSMIGTYLTDPYCFVLYYGLGLEEPQQLSPNLFWGNLFHKGLELLLNQPQRIKETTPEEWKVVADEIMAEYNTYQGIPRTFPLSVLEMLKLYDDGFTEKQEPLPSTEFKFYVPYKTKQNAINLKGKIDVYQKTPTTCYLGEHKCKKTYDRLVTKTEVPYDLQVNFYLLALQHYDVYPTKIIYDLIKIPDVQYNCPRQHERERTEAYVQRLYYTHKADTYPISRNKMFWLDQITVPTRPDYTLAWRKNTLDPIVDRICDLYNYCSKDSFDIHDSFNQLFHHIPLRHFNPSLTDSFKRKYHNLLTGQTTFADLVPVKNLFSELEDL